MVRAGVPIPVGLRMKLTTQNMRRLHPQGHANGQTASGISADLSADSSAIGLARTSNAAPSGPILPEAALFSEDPILRAIVNEFIHKYDDLISLLCYTAQEGVDYRRRERYNELRQWFLQYYDRVRPIVHAQLNVDEMASQREVEVFEALFMSQDISMILHSDSIMECMIRTRMAVEKCRNILGTRIY